MICWARNRKRSCLKLGSSFPIQLQPKKPMATIKMGMVPLMPERPHNKEPPVGWNICMAQKYNRNPDSQGPLSHTTRKSKEWVAATKTNLVPRESTFCKKGLASQRSGDQIVAQSTERFGAGADHLWMQKNRLLGSRHLICHGSGFRPN